MNQLCCSTCSLRREPGQGWSTGSLQVAFSLQGPLSPCPPIPHAPHAPYSSNCGCCPWSLQAPSPSSSSHLLPLPLQGRGVWYSLHGQGSWRLKGTWGPCMMRECWLGAGSGVPALWCGGCTVQHGMWPMQHMAPGHLEVGQPRTKLSCTHCTVINFGTKSALSPHLQTSV